MAKQEELAARLAGSIAADAARRERMEALWDEYGRRKDAEADVRLSARAAAVKMRVADASAQNRGVLHGKVAVAAAQKAQVAVEGTAVTAIASEHAAEQRAAALAAKAALRSMGDALRQQIAARAVESPSRRAAAAAAAPVPNLFILRTDSSDWDTEAAFVSAMRRARKEAGIAKGTESPLAKANDSGLSGPLLGFGARSAIAIAAAATGGGGSA